MKEITGRVSALCDAKKDRASKESLKGTVLNSIISTLHRKFLHLQILFLRNQSSEWGLILVRPPPLEFVRLRRMGLTRRHRVGRYLTERFKLWLKTPTYQADEF